MSDEKTVDNAAASNNTSSQGIASVAGKRVGGETDGNKKKMLFYFGAALLVGAALCFGYWFFFVKGNSADSLSSQQGGNQGGEQQTAGSLTSTRELAPVNLPSESKKEEKEPQADEQSKAVEIPMPIPAASVGVDADGKPLPTLEELKFAAPMMGEQPEKQTAESPVYTPPATGATGAGALALGGATSGGSGGLSQMLKPTSTPRSGAKVIKEQSMTLSKGTVIECILETRVDTTVPGMTSCVIPRNIYSMNGRVLLVEKGTKAIGEYQGAVQNGLARIFMLWTELRTPNGVSIAINSPTADSLGGSGMGGYVDYHWWKRFGNALMFSMVQDGFQYIVNSANNSTNNGYVTYENTQNGMEEIIKEAMQQSGNIPPTLIKNQGEKVSIFVARDLNFSSVYSLSANQ